MNLICGKKKICEKKADEEVIEMTKKDKQCYGCLVERYEEKIIRYVKRISGVSDETAEDITQNIFLKVYINLNAFDPKLKFSSWLYRIAHNETINYWRRNKRRKEAKISWDDNEALRNVIKDKKDTEQEVYQKITNEKLLEAINRLDKKYQDVILLNYLEGQSYQEIADILKKPMGTVGTLINRAKLKLVEELKKAGVGKHVANK